MNSQIIKYLLSYENFETYGKFLRKEHFQDDATSWEIYGMLKLYFKENTQDLTIKGLGHYHIGLVQDQYSQERLDILKQRYNEIHTCEISEVAEHFFRQLELQHELFLATRDLSEMAYSPDAERMGEIAERLARLSTSYSEEDGFDIPTFEELEQMIADATKWEWFDKDIEEALRGFGPERVVMVFALSNVGKSSFVTTVCEDFMEQGAKVLDISISEDSRKGRFMRFMQAYYHISDAELETKLNAFYEEFMEIYRDKLFMKNVPRCSITDIRRWIRQCEPDVVVVDNYTKVKMVQDREAKGHKAVGNVMTELKAMAKEFQFGLIAVCQASASAEHYVDKDKVKKKKKKLTQMDMQDSNIDVPAELDGAIGITSGEYDKSVRHISFPKSKFNSEAEDKLLYRRLNAETNEWS